MREKLASLGKEIAIANRDKDFDRLLNISHKLYKMARDGLR